MDETSEFDTTIIGAGWSGLLACKAFKEAGFRPVVLERNPYIGGVWHHDVDSTAGGVIKSTFTTSSKTTTEHGDFPMPAHFPEFPRHEQILEYLNAYCDAFGLREHLRLGSGVSRVRKDGEHWIVESEGGTYRCERVVVCAGVHQEATSGGRDQFVDFPGVVMHSTELEKRHDELVDKRVLILGSGETASDMAGEITRLTPHLSLSSPNGQWIVNRVSSLAAPRPIVLDQHSSPLRELADPSDASFYGAEIVETFYGRCGSGVPEWQTDKPYLSQFFNKNDIIVRLWRTGQLTARCGIARVDGSTVHFEDGTRDEYDVIVLCTGFETVFPFLPEPYDRRPINEHFKLMLADDPTLSFVGFARPVVGSIPTIAEMQSRCLAAMYAGSIPLPEGREQVIERDLAAFKERYQTERLSGLVDLPLYTRELAVWLGVFPDYPKLVREHPRDAWILISAPYNGARFWLGDPDRYDAIVALLRERKHPYLENMAYWSYMLFTNAFPANADRTYHKERYIGLRRALRYPLLPLFFPAALLSSVPPNLLTTVYGSFLLFLLSPILAWRYRGYSREVERIREEFYGGVPAAG